MAKRSEITKVGLAVVIADRLLLVRKRNKPSFILPGGKPEVGESNLDALIREIREELGCNVGEWSFEAQFSDEAADIPDTDVTVVLYTGTLAGEPSPLAEIEELAWLDLSDAASLKLAPSITNHILPYLRSRAAAYCF